MASRKAFVATCTGVDIMNFLLRLSTVANSLALLKKSVSIAPGQTVVTTMPRGITSLRKALEKEMTNAFVAP